MGELAENPNRSSKSRPATNSDAREKQCIAAAMDLAERQLREGTASAQVICHFLKLATEKEKLERLYLESQLQLNSEKVESLKSSKRVEDLYEEAIAAMRRYSGQSE